MPTLQPAVTANHLRRGLQLDIARVALLQCRLKVQAQGHGLCRKEQEQQGRADGCQGSEGQFKGATGSVVGSNGRTELLASHQVSGMAASLANGPMSPPKLLVRPQPTLAVPPQSTNAAAILLLRGPA